MKKKQTRREKFLAEMEAVVPWTRLLALIEPHYPKVGPKGGRPPMPLETTLRVYFLQQWYALIDPLADEMLYDSDAMRHFTGVELGDDQIPDETTILNFHHLVEKHQLTERLLVAVSNLLADPGITLRSDIPVDVGRRTPCIRVSLRKIIDVPSSNKNNAGVQEPHMSSTKKGNQCYFRSAEDQKRRQWRVFPENEHVSVDAHSGIVHSLETGTAKVHDNQVWDDLLYGEETLVCPDRGYASAARESAFSGPGKFWGVIRKAPRGSALHPCRRRHQQGHRQGARSGRASLSDAQASVRASEDPPPRASEQPRAALHSLRSRQPVPRATQPVGMRQSLPSGAIPGHRGRKRLRKHSGQRRQGSPKPAPIPNSARPKRSIKRSVIPSDRFAIKLDTTKAIDPPSLKYGIRFAQNH
jgi:IS5 family transposase